MDDYADFDMLDGGDGDGGDDAALDEADTANLAELFRQSQREKAEFLDLNVSLQEKLASYLASVKKSEPSGQVRADPSGHGSRLSAAVAWTLAASLGVNAASVWHNLTNSAMATRSPLDDERHGPWY